MREKEGTEGRKSGERRKEGERMRREEREKKGKECNKGRGEEWRGGEISKRVSRKRKKRRQSVNQPIRKQQ